MERYNVHAKKDKEQRAKMDKLSKFVDMLCKNKRPHEIKNELTYFISVVWDLSWTHERKDSEWLEAQQKIQDVVDENTGELLVDNSHLRRNEDGVEL
jgi:hypothetical protein